MKRWVILLLFIFPLSAYEFKGTHYFASYKGCDSKRLEDVTQLYEYFLHGVDQSGATILKHDMYKFSEISITAVAILSESHASLHSYPEHQSCFVDLFTCGDHTNWQKFHEVMISYLRPEKVEYKVMERL